MMIVSFIIIIVMWDVIEKIALIIFVLLNKLNFYKMKYQIEIEIHIIIFFLHKLGLSYSFNAYPFLFDNG